MAAYRYVALIETLIALSLSESGLFFTIEPAPVEITRTGGTASFACAVSGITAPEIEWYKGSNRFIPDRGRVTETVVEGPTTHHILTIHGVRHSTDVGEYSCKAENMMGTIQSRKAKLTAPYFLKDRDYFTINPELTYQTKPGKGVIIPCQFDNSASWPEAEIFWRKYSTQLIEDERFDNIWETESRFISKLNGTMVIAQAKAEDSGTYRCGFRNTVLGTISESSVKTRLTVDSDGTGSMGEYEADIYVPRQTISVVRRQMAKLECIPYGYPPPTIEWSKEDGELPTRAQVSANTALLTIPNFDVNDVGRYTCTAYQRNEKVRQRVIQLNILEPPEFIQPNQELTVMEDEDLTIPCDCSGSPEPKITWYKNTVQQDNDNQDSLTLTTVSASDNAMYQCVCENDAGNAQATFSVQVKGPAKIITEARHKTVGRGTSVTLTCEAQGSPTPSIVWLKDGQRLRSDLRIQHYENLYESRISISDVSKEDNGVYECKAINENGDDSIYISIRVYGEPFINVKPKDTVGITGSDIIVTCQATAEPKPEITWYRNERQITADDADKYEVTDEYLKIKNGHAVDGGSFMCQARNSEGTESSKPVQVTVYNVPTISHSLPAQTNVTAGKKGLLLPCAITKDFASYQWYRRGIPLLKVYFDGGTQARIETKKGIGLYFQTVLPEDQGEYSCNVSNPAAEANVSGYLYVDVMPSIPFISPNTEVREYSTFWLHCQYQGEPKPTLSWTHNNTPLIRSNTVYPNGTLKITSATRFDAGVYQCTVSNRQGSRSKDVIVMVRSSARIENIPSLQYPITGERSTLICEVSGFPFPVVEWWKNGIRIQSNSNFNTDGYSRDGSNLIIQNPDSARHDGLYTCKATNDYGSESHVTQVSVYDLPKVTRVSGCDSVTADMECTIVCEARGNPLPTLSWRYKDRNETIVAQTDNDKYYVTSQDVTLPVPYRELSLTFRSITGADSRTYFCHAENPAGKTSTAHQVKVSYQAVIDSPPLPTYEVPIGATLTITCKARGEPVPQIRWKGPRPSLPPNGRSTVDEDGSLVLMNIQNTDEGDYTCFADNNKASNSFTFDVVSRTTTVKVTSKDAPLTVIDNPIETWLIVVIVICVFVVCIVVFVSVKMIRDRSRERRSYKPTQMTKTSSEEANYQYETVTPKPVMFQVPIDTSNSLPMYNLRTLNWADGKHPPNNFQSQFDDVDRQLQGLLKDLDNPKLDNLESDI